MVICKRESILQSHVIANFDKYFDFNYVSREFKISSNTEHRVDIVGENERSIYLIELKLNRITPRHLAQIRFYVKKYREEINPAKVIKGILAAPRCSSEALEEIQKDPLLDIVLLSDVYAKDPNPRGRKPMPEAEKAKNRAIKFTDEEWEEIRIKAEAEGISRAEYIKRKAL